MTTANTIYEYYERTDSDRYYLARLFTTGGREHIKYLWQPLAEPLHIRDLEDFDLFVYREGKAMMMCEALTGAVIINQAQLENREQRRMNKKQFIAALPAMIATRGGRAEINSIIVNFIFDHDQLISPRYRAKEV